MKGGLLFDMHMLGCPGHSFEDWAWEDFGVRTAATPASSSKRGRSVTPSEEKAGVRAKRGRKSRGGRADGSSRARGRGRKAAKPPPLAPVVGKKSGRGVCIVPCW